MLEISSGIWKSPSRLIIAPLDTRKNRFDYYHERIEDLDIPFPNSEIVNLKNANNIHQCDWDTKKIQHIMQDWNSERAFVRSQYKSAPKRLHSGSHITNRKPKNIDNTIQSLLNQLDAAGWKHGGSLVIRELIDLNFCTQSYHEYCHPEVRFFIEDGDVIGYTPNLDETEFVCDQAYEHLDSVLKPINTSNLQKYIKQVVLEFDEDTWCVDFAMDTSGQWYCIEMGLNAVRWDAEIQDWINHCDHGELAPYSPCEVHSTALNMKCVLNEWDQQVIQ